MPTRGPPFKRGSAVHLSSLAMPARALGACPVIQGPAATPSLVLVDLSLATKWRAPSWRPRLSTDLVPMEAEQRSQFWEFPVASVSSWA